MTDTELPSPRSAWPITSRAPVAGTPAAATCSATAMAEPAASMEPPTADRFAATPISGGYRPEIDGLRAIAVLAVVIAHLHGPVLPSGFLGVDVFFVISGTVITASLAGRGATSLGSFLAGFYSRRCRRLLPALVLVLLVTGLLLCLVNPRPEASLRTGAAAFFGLSNLQLWSSSTDYFAVSTDLNPFLHTWSLGVEEQFYLLYPLLLWTVGWPRQSPGAGRHLAWTLGGLSLASLALFLLLLPSQPSAAYFLVPARFWEMGAGGLIALVAPALLARLSGRIASGLAGLALGLLLGLMVLPVRLALVLPAVLLSAVLIAVLPRAGGPRRWLSQRWLVALGLRSYSLYLWHWGVLALSRLTIGVSAWTLPFQLLLMLGLANASYHWIETPIRRYRGPWPPARQIGFSLLAAASGTAWFAWAGVVGVGRSLYLGRSAEDQWAQVARVDPDSSLSEQQCGAWTPASLAKCVLPASAANRPLLVVLGDSHTMHLFPLLGLLHRRDGLGIAAFTTAGNQHQPFPSPPLRPAGVDPGFYAAEGGEIRQFWDVIRRRLAPGDSVVLSSYLERYFGQSGRFTFVDLSGRTVPRGQALRLWLDQVARLADALEPRHVNLLVVLPLPWFSMPRGQWWNGSGFRYPPEVCTQQWFRPNLPEACSLSVDRGALLRQRQPLLDDLRALQRQHPNLLLYDPLPVLCPADRARCSTHLQGEREFGDENHLSVHGSRRLYTDFRAFLRRHGLLKRAPVESRAGD